MKKFTSMLMSALVLLQVGGNIAGAKDLNDTKIETISIKAPETNNKKFVVIQKENKGISLGTKIASIAGASILAGLGAFGVYKYVTNKKEDAKKKEDENKNKEENPMQQLLKSKNIEDPADLSNDELERLKSEINQQISSDAGGPGDTTKTKTKQKLQGQLDQIDRILLQRSQSQSQNDQTESNRTLALVKGAPKVNYDSSQTNTDTTSERHQTLDQSQFPKHNLKGEPSGSSSSNASNRTLAIVKSPDAADDDKKLQQKVDLKIPNQIKQQTIKPESFEFYIPKDKIKIEGADLTFKSLDEMPRYLTPGNFKFDSYDPQYQQKVIFTIPTSDESEPVSVIGMAYFRRAVWGERPNLGSNVSSWICSINVWLNGKKCEARQISTSYINPCLDYREGIYDTTYMTHGRWGSACACVTLIPPLPQLQSDGSPGVEADIDRFMKAYTEPYSDDIPDSGKDIMPLALLSNHALNKQLARYGLRQVGPNNYSPTSGISQIIHVTRIWLQGEKVTVRFDPQFDSERVLPLIINVNEGTKFSTLHSKLVLDPNSQFGYPVRLWVVPQGETEAGKYLELAARTSAGGQFNIPEDLELSVMSVLKTFKIEDYSKLFKTTNTIEISNMGYCGENSSIPLDMPMNQVSGLIVKVNDKNVTIPYESYEKKELTLAKFISSHNGSNGLQLNGNDTDQFYTANLLGCSPKCLIQHLNEHPVKIEGFEIKKNSDSQKSEQKPASENINFSSSASSTQID